MRARLPRFLSVLVLGGWLATWLGACATPTAADTVAIPRGKADGAAEGERSSSAFVVVHYDTGWGHSIALRGDGAGLTWTQGTAATWTDGNAWKATLTVAGPVNLKPVLDDKTWAKGPNWTIRPGQTLDVWPAFVHDAGRFERIEGWRSPKLADPRDIMVYLPPSYDENLAERYPVVYMHDGGNLYFDSEAFGGTSWDVAGSMDRGFADGTIHEAIVVGVYATAARIYEYTPTDGGYQGGGADRYLAFLADELKPEMDRRYRTVSDRAHTATMGSSLGGLIALDASVQRPEVFGLIGALSPSTWWDGTWIIGHVQGETTLPVRVYVDSGDAGTSNDDVQNTKKLADVFKARGASLDYVVQHGGQHSEIYWRQRFPGAASFLLGSR